MMKTYVRAIAFIVTFFVAGCATTYQPNSFSGGYSDFQIDPSTVRVSFRGNGYTEKGLVEVYLLYRSAEITVNQGFDWFVISEREGEREWDPKYGNLGVTSTAVIKMYRGPKPDSIPRSYDARLAIQSMAKSIKR